jgi:hypothetical protein
MPKKLLFLRNLKEYKAVNEMDKSCSKRERKK